MTKPDLFILIFSLYLCLLANFQFTEAAHEGLNGIKEKLTEMLQLNLPSASQKPEVPQNLQDPKHGIAMGIMSDNCDNAKDLLEVDWDGSPINHTCYAPRKAWLPVNTRSDPLISCDTIPKDYSPQHHCMNESITYESTIPTHEGHRPLWPVFGEYNFVPPQRWLHNIEHGAVVMLYHPCAEPFEVKRLKKLVKSCLWKYIITPWNMLPLDMPLALVAWGCRMQMSYVDPPMVRYFIRNKAFKGPEAHYMKQGQYTEGLKEASEIPSDPSKDTVLC